MKQDKLIPELRFPEFENEGEWRKEKLDNITTSENSSLTLNKLELKKSGYPVFGADSIVGYIDEFQHNKRYISIVKDGSGVGRLNLCESKSSILGTLTSLKSKDEEKFNLDWIYYLLNTIDFSSYVKGSGIPHIYFSDYKNENIAIPRPTEQQKIASTLSSLDEIIEAEKQKLDLLKEHKTGLMQNLFPQKGEKVPKLRFKEFEKDGEWERKKLGELGDPLMCRRIFKDQTTTDSKQGIPFYKIGTFGKEPDAYISLKLFEEYKAKYNFPKTGDILISASGTIGRLVIYDGKPAYFQDSNIIWLENDEKSVLNNFLFYCYSMIEWQTSDGGVIKRLYNSDFRNMEINFPKRKTEQQKTASFLSNFDEMIQAQAERIAELEEHKKGLMQGLFPKIKD